VQKLIRVKGAGRILELGRSVERAAKPKAVEEVELIPERIVNFEPAVPDNDTVIDASASNDSAAQEIDDEILRPISAPPMPAPKARPSAGARLVPVVHSVELEGADFIAPHENEIEVEDDLEDEAEAEYEAAKDAIAAPPEPSTSLDHAALNDALARLKMLRGKWTEFQSKA